MEVRIIDGCYSDEYPIVKADIKQTNSGGLWSVPIGVHIVFDLRDGADMAAGIMIARLTLAEAKMLSVKLSELCW